VPAVSVAVTLTLLPALLATVGQRIVGRAATVRRRQPRRTAWARLSCAANGPPPGGGGSAAALSAAASGIKIGEPRGSALGTTTPPPSTAHPRAPACRSACSTQSEVLTPPTDPAQLARRLSALPGVRTATAPLDPRGAATDSWSASSLRPPLHPRAPPPGSHPRRRAPRSTVAPGPAAR
jgi:hypothetical protein